MIIDVSNRSHRWWTVEFLEGGDPNDSIQYADDETGEYRVLLRDSNGESRLETRFGKIKLVYQTKEKADWDYKLKQQSLQRKPLISDVDLLNIIKRKLSPFNRDIKDIYRLIQSINDLIKTCKFNSGSKINSVDEVETMRYLC